MKSHRQIMKILIFSLKDLSYLEHEIIRPIYSTYYKYTYVHII